MRPDGRVGGIVIEMLQAWLSAARNADGGWGAGPGLPSCTEMTSLAALALRASGAPEDGAVQWLVGRQQPDGSWPYYEGVPGPSWSTSLAILALADAGGHADAVRSGVAWQLEQAGLTPTWRDRIRQFLMPQDQVVDLDLNIPGWSWTPETFSWVEPTSWALLALKRARPQLDSRALTRRIEDGEALLRDRVCTGGGWNYGNRLVLAQSLDPFPDTTALALLALHDVPPSPAVTEGISALNRLLEVTESGLALSLGLLARRAHGLEPGDLAERLARSFEDTHFLEQTRVVALALLSLADAQALVVTDATA